MTTPKAGGDGRMTVETTETYAEYEERCRLQSIINGFCEGLSVSEPKSHEEAELIGLQFFEKAEALRTRDERIRELEKQNVELTTECVRNGYEAEHPGPITFYDGEDGVERQIVFEVEDSEAGLPGGWVSEDNYRPIREALYFRMKQVIEALHAARKSLRSKVTQLERARDDWKLRHDSLNEHGYSVARERDSLKAEMVELKADRDSWIKQCEDARELVLKIGREGDSLKDQLAAKDRQLERAKWHLQYRWIPGVNGFNTFPKFWTREVLEEPK